MNDTDRLQWGAQEDAQRKNDIVAVKAGSMTLEQAQQAARRRIRVSGMTRAEAYAALIDAQKSQRNAVT
jgi:hypothetical protein